ncbi:MAG: hypothetical protein ACR2JH_08010 [Solirubrobacteraceae bacterium]
MEKANQHLCAGDCVVIPPGTPHELWNPREKPLVQVQLRAGALRRRHRDDGTLS